MADETPHPGTDVNAPLARGPSPRGPRERGGLSEGCPQPESKAGVRKKRRGAPPRTVTRVADSDKVVFAQEQRREPTRVERDLWELLRDGQFGFKLRRQHPFHDFVLDFYCAEAKLCVEIDGPHHQRQQGYDEWRTEQLQARGVQVLRVPEAEARTSLPKVAMTIRRTCVERCKQT